MPRPGWVDAAHDRGARAVAEQDRGGAVLKSVMVDSFSAPDHEHGPALARRDEPFGDGEGVDVAGTGGGDVERRGVVGAEQRLEVAGGGRQQPVGARGGEHDASSSSGLTPGALAARSRWPRGSASRRVCSGPAMRRSRMPVRSTIHSSEVSSIRARSWLVTTRGGTAVPTLASSAKGRGIMPAPPSGAGRTPRRCAGSAPPARPGPRPGWRS